MATDTFRQDLQCHVREITYNFKFKTGKLIAGRNAYVDMDGCIALFKAIDPKVWWIRTYRGRNAPRGDHTPDTDYILRDDKWIAEVMYERQQQR